MASLGGISLERDVPIEEIADYLHDPDNLVWMDIQDPGQAEIAMLMEEFGFHPLALDDVVTGVQRPKVDEYRGYVFLVVFGVRAGSEPGSFETTELDLFIGRNYLVTCHRRAAPQLEEALRRWTGGGEMLREGVGFLVYAVMDALIDAYFPVVHDIEEQLDQIELEIFTEADEPVPQKLLALKRDLFTLRRLAQPLREVFGTFIRPDQALFSSNTTVYFQNVYDRVLRILDVVDAERDMVGSALEAHLTVISTRLNVTMKTLTVVSVVLGTGAAVFGAWGMNVPGLPWADHPAGFWFVVVGMIALISGALLMARKRRWL
jgi:magnesium transporter